jgi:UDP-N-acetylmuramoyl-tripeptide--D-alanyl-D-alanine ligase
MAELELHDIAAVVGGRVIGAPARLVMRDYSFDSRDMKPHALFFAMRSQRNDGHRYVPQLAALDGAAAVVRRGFRAEAAVPSLVEVDDPLRAAQRLAAHVRERHPRVTYVGVTGSAGKTTTKEFIFQLLASRGSAFRSLLNWNNWIGLPFSLLKMNGDETSAVFELAMSDPGIGEIDLLAGILRPDVALLLNALPVHLEYLKTVENVARAKAEILNHLASDGCAFVNGDNPLLRQAVAGKPGRKVFFGRIPGVNEVVLREVIRETVGCRLHIDFWGLEREFHTTIVNRTQIENLFAAILVAHHLGMKHDEIQAALPAVRPLDNRGAIRSEKGITIVDETYNSNPQALEKALRWVDEEFAAPKTAVLGDMLELGEDEQIYHDEVGRVFAGLGYGRLVTVGTRARAIAAGARSAGFDPAAIRCFEDAAAAGAFLREHLQPGTTVLFKASRGIGLEKALEALLA